MSAKALKIAATVAVVVLALPGSLFATLREDTQFYKHVDEVMSDPAAWQGRRQLPRLRRRHRTEAQFARVSLQRSEQRPRGPGPLHRRRPGHVQRGAEVVLKGTLSPDGFHVERNGVMAKCPSKYEPSKGALPNTSGS